MFFITNYKPGIRNKRTSRLKCQDAWNRRLSWLYIADPERRGALFHG